MRLLGAFFNIFIFYYFLALCGSPEGQTAGSVEGVESLPAQSLQKEEKPCKTGEDSCEASTLSFASPESLFLAAMPS
ncbi:MAG: hypothetical protein H6557_30965 [Lewinellaceae bacterium]|nr:hypothetical protein [Phaeodactylibacter sp.]MCB9041072.1 hypothetical protein [Lewinellaceae bacterium]